MNQELSKQAITAPPCMLQVVGVVPLGIAACKLNEYSRKKPSVELKISRENLEV